MMGVLCEKVDPSGNEQVRERDQGKAIAGKSTLNRLELTPEGANEKSRYKKIVAEAEKIDDLMFFFYLPAHPEIYTLSLHDALPISAGSTDRGRAAAGPGA